MPIAEPQWRFFVTVEIETVGGQKETMVSTCDVTAPTWYLARQQARMVLGVEVDAMTWRRL